MRQNGGKTANDGRLLAQVARDKKFFSDLQNIFSDWQNSLLNLATILGFANLCEICKTIFVDSIILLRFVVVFQISKLFNDDFQKTLRFEYFFRILKIFVWILKICFRILKYIFGF